MGIELIEVGYDDLVVQQLAAEVQAEYAQLYGGDGDISPMDAVSFAAPLGRFFLARLNGETVGMGGWRRGGPRDGDAEIKRMYVRARRRRNGIARVILTELERTAAAAGIARLVLETGTAQPEAIAMYRAAGYLDIPRFGHYAAEPDAIHLGKALSGIQV